MTASSFLNNTVSDLTTIVHHPHRLFCILNTDVSRSELGTRVHPYFIKYSTACPLLGTPIT